MKINWALLHAAGGTVAENRRVQDALNSITEEFKFH